MKSLAAHIKRASLAMVMLSSVAAFQAAYAVGTPANTDITNTAKVDYKVGTVDQTQVSSNAVSFKVDRKVDLNVTALSQTTVNPNQTGAGVPFTVTNTGNGTDSFTLAGANQGSDNFDVSNIRIYKDSTTSGPLAGVYDNSDTLVSAPVSLNADESAVFFIVSDIPITATNGQHGTVQLTATTTSTQTVGADNPLAVDVVFADTGRDGTEATTNQYNVAAATLSVVKSAAIISDPINLTGANRKAIPGAIIEYTIVVTNSGTANATAVSVSDPIPANTTYVPGSMQLGATTLTDAADADGGSTTGTPVTAVTVNAGTIASGGGTATVKFRVTIVP